MNLRVQYHRSRISFLLLFVLAFWLSGCISVNINSEIKFCRGDGLGLVAPKWYANLEIIATTDDIDRGPGVWDADRQIDEVVQGWEAAGGEWSWRRRTNEGHYVWLISGVGETDRIATRLLMPGYESTLYVYEQLALLGESSQITINYQSSPRRIYIDGKPSSNLNVRYFNFSIAADSILTANADRIERGYFNDTAYWELPSFNEINVRMIEAWCVESFGPWIIVIGSMLTGVGITIFVIRRFRKRSEPSSVDSLEKSRRVVPLVRNVGVRLTGKLRLWEKRVSDFLKENTMPAVFPGDDPVEGISTLVVQDSGSINGLEKMTIVIAEVDEGNYVEEIRKYQGKVAAYFYSKETEPNELSSVFNRLAIEHIGEMKCVKIDIDKNREFWNAREILRTPTIKLYKEGMVQANIELSASIEEIERLLRLPRGRGTKVYHLRAVSIAANIAILNAFITLLVAMIQFSGGDFIIAGVLNTIASVSFFFGSFAIRNFAPGIYENSLKTIRINIVWIGLQVLVISAGNFYIEEYMIFVLGFWIITGVIFYLSLRIAEPAFRNFALSSRSPFVKPEITSRDSKGNSTQDENTPVVPLIREVLSSRKPIAPEHDFGEKSPCPNCAELIELTAKGTYPKFCRHCGARLSEDIPE